ncbi:MAG TPA: NTP transferase domain-containing protein [Terrimicrobiaceae bacterium]
MISSAGIIAAGEGSRLRMGGVGVNKPLVPIAGWPLIGHTLRQFVEMGIRRVVVIFNESEQDCAEWVQTHFPTLDLEIMLRSTRSSFESFWRVGRALGPGRHLICTVDSICAAADWRTMIASRPDANSAIFLGITSFVHDEKPLWVRLDPSGIKIAEIGGVRSHFATAGIYNVCDAIFEREFDESIPSLRVFLRKLLAEGFPLCALPLQEVVDIDTVEDIDLAERFLSQIRGAA